MIYKAPKSEWTESGRVGEWKLGGRIIIIIIIIIIKEQINVAYSPKTSRTRNKPKKENSDVFGRWKHSKSQRH